MYVQFYCTHTILIWTHGMSEKYLFIGLNVFFFVYVKLSVVKKLKFFAFIHCTVYVATTQYSFIQCSLLTYKPICQTVYVSIDYYIVGLFIILSMWRRPIFNHNFHISSVVYQLTSQSIYYTLYVILTIT